MFEATGTRRALQLLSDRLPPGWAVSSSRFVPSGGPDALWELSSPDGAKVSLAVEVKSQITPRLVPRLSARIKSWSETALVVSEFISSTTRQYLQAEGLNYIDLAGNVRLVLSKPGLFIEARGAIGHRVPGVPSRSLRGSKAGRLVRTLCDFPPPLAVSEIAAKAGVAVSYASRVVDWLDQEALVQREPRGPVTMVRRDSLIRRWTVDYSVLKSNLVQSFLDPRGLDNMQRKLASCPLRYAVTGSLAAVRIAPIAVPRLAMLYVEEADAAAEYLTLRPAEEGANVMLLSPFDPVVFERTKRYDGVVYVAATQAAADLLTSPGRAPSEAEAVLEFLQQEQA